MKLGKTYIFLLAGAALALLLFRYARVNLPLDEKVRYERALEKRGDEILLKLLGPGQARVVVAATLKTEAEASPGRRAESVPPEAAEPDAAKTEKNKSGARPGFTEDMRDAPKDTEDGSAQPEADGAGAVKSGKKMPSLLPGFMEEEPEGQNDAEAVSAQPKAAGPKAAEPEAVQNKKKMSELLPGFEGETPEAQEAPKAPEAQEAQEAQETPKAQEAPKALKAPEAPVDTKARKAPKVAEAAKPAAVKSVRVARHNAGRKRRKVTAGLPGFIEAMPDAGNVVAIPEAPKVTASVPEAPKAAAAIPAIPKSAEALPEARELSADVLAASGEVSSYSDKVSKLSVSIIVEGELEQSQIDSMKELVGRGLELDMSRGDTLEVVRVPVPAWKVSPDSLGVIVRYGIAGLLIIISLIIAGFIMLKLAGARRQADKAQKPEASPGAFAAESYAEARPMPVRPVEAQPAPFIPLEVQPALARPVEAQPAPFIPLEVKPAPPAPVEIQPAPAIPAEVQPAPFIPIEVQPAPAIPVEVQPAPPAPVEIQSAPPAPVEIQPAPAIPVEVQPAPPAPVEIQPAPAMAVELQPEAPAPEYGVEERRESEAEAAQEGEDRLIFNVKRGQIPLLASMLRKEEPENISLVVCHLPDEIRGELLSNLGRELAAQVILKLAIVRFIDREMLVEIKHELEKRLDRAEGGVEKAVEVIATMPYSEKKELVRQTAAYDPELGAEIRSAFIFDEDLLSLSGKDLAVVAAAVPAAQWAEVFPGLPGDLRERMKKIISAQAVQLAEQAMNRAAPGRRRLNRAMGKFIAIVEELVKDGRIPKPAPPAAPAGLIGSENTFLGQSLQDAGGGAS